MGKTLQCPNCGNYVEGKKIKSYANKVARQGAKTLVHSANGFGAATTGAALGSAILPGIGTVLGAAAGFIGSAMFNQKVNESIDKAGDFVEDEFAEIEYEYVCPKCGKRWRSNRNATYSSSISKSVQNNSTGKNKNSTTKLNDIQFLVINIVSQQFHTPINLDNSFSILADQSKQLIVQRIEQELDVAITPQVFNQFSTYRDLADYVEENIPTETSAQAIILRIAKGVLGPSERNIDSSFAQLGRKNKEKFRKAIGEKCSIYIDYGTLFSFNTYRDIASHIVAEGWHPEKEAKLQNENLKNRQSDKYCDNASAAIAKDSNDQEYLDALKDFLDDGEISDRERRMLNRVRISLGISEEHAAELEASLNGVQLTEDEQEYLEMYQEYAAEGVITEKARKRLERFASAIGLSPERIKELETM